MRGNFKLFIFLVFLFLATAFSSFYLFNILYPPENATFSSVVLGKAEYGTVIREGPYGNTDSPNRIVYIVGVHPLEYQVHQALLESVANSNESLKNCYYIYRVNVTQDAGDYEKSRSNGQLLANKYVVPDIKNMSIGLVIDIHSNEGNYQKTQFIFLPKYSEKSKSIALEIKNEISWLSIYSPPNPTSPAYVTIPLIEGGIPSLIYETNTYEPINQTRKQTQELVSVVDKLDL